MFESGLHCFVYGRGYVIYLNKQQYLPSKLSIQVTG